MKSQAEISQILFFLMEVVILIAGSILVYKLVSTAWQPHRAVAFANAERLRLAIDDVCAGRTSTTLDFDFPQPEPFTFGGFSGAANIFPKFFVRTFGDPYYVLYYEAFPPGEGVSWEFNADLKRRAVIPFVSDKATIPNAAQEIEITKERLKPRVGDVEIIFPNIILEDGYAGKWSDDGNRYMFSNYMFLPPMNKSAIKYRACGANTLCLKTRDGIYKLPLPHCWPIETIQMTFSHGTTDGYMLLAGLLTGQQSDFNIVSPCSGKITIESTECMCDDDTSDVTRKVSYKLYSYDVAADTLSEIRQPSATPGITYEAKSHASCWHRIGGVTSEEDGSARCIRISLSDRSNLCTSGNAAITGIPVVYAQWRPVRDSTEFATPLDVSAAIMKDSKTVSESLKGGYLAPYQWAWP